MKQLTLSLIVFTILLAACTPKDINGDLKNRRDILESRTWKLTKITDNGGPTSLPDCQKDNYYVFIAGGTGKYEEGAVNCLDSLNTGNAPTFTGFKWQMPGDLRFIYFLDWGGDPEDRFEWEVRDMKFEKFEVRQWREIDGIDHRIDMTFESFNP